MAATARPATPQELTEAVVRRYDSCEDDRLREVMQALVRHLHGFAIEVGLTEAEWGLAIAELTATGHITDERRQEFILWSDSLGLSNLVDALANPLPPGVTESTVIGPFYSANAPLREYGESMVEEADEQGTPAWVHGRILGPDGEPVPGAELDIWQNGFDELYAVQKPEGEEDHLRGLYVTRADGTFAFTAVRPVPYPIPYDGPVGKMLAATGRHPWRPAHIHVIVRAPGYRTVVTHLFDEESEYLDSDAVFAVKPSLLRRFIPRDPDDPARPASIPHGDWVSLESDIILLRGGDRPPVVDPGRTA